MAGDGCTIEDPGECGLVAGAEDPFSSRASQAADVASLGRTDVQKKGHQKNLAAISDDGELGLMQLMDNGWKSIPIPPPTPASPRDWGAPVWGRLFVLRCTMHSSVPPIPR